MNSLCEDNLAIGRVSGPDLDHRCHCSCGHRKIDCYPFEIPQQRAAHTQTELLQTLRLLIFPLPLSVLNFRQQLVSKVNQTMKPVTVYGFTHVHTCILCYMNE